MKVSTGLRNYILATDDVAAGLNGGVIKLYGSTVSEADAQTLIPATADAAIGSAVLLCTISNDGAGTGINLDTTPSNGVIGKASGEVWRGEMVASGYFSFARFCTDGDTHEESTDEKRLQLTVGVLGKEIIVSTAYKAIGDEQRIDQFYLGMPAE